MPLPRRLTTILSKLPKLPLLRTRKALPSLSPREKARKLVAGIQEDTLACVRQQRHLMGQASRERREAFNTLATAFIEGNWAPEGLSREDVEAIPEWLIRAIVLCTADGRPIGGYEVKIHEYYLQSAASTSVPQVQKPR